MTNQKLVVNAATGEAVTRDLTPDEQASHDAEAAAWEAGEHARQQAEVDAQRHAAYVAESDPLFFQWQAGEITEQEWLDKRAEIKTRYPNPEV